MIHHDDLDPLADQGAHDLSSDDFYDHEITPHLGHTAGEHHPDLEHTAGEHDFGHLDHPETYSSSFRDHEGTELAPRDARYDAWLPGHERHLPEITNSAAGSGTYQNPDGTVHWTADNTDRDPLTGVIVRHCGESTGASEPRFGYYDSDSHGNRIEVTSTGTYDLKGNRISWDR
jgi:hypothetical protein